MTRISFILFAAALSIFSFQNCSGFKASSLDASSNSGSSINLPGQIANGDTQPLPATSGTPKVHQIRNGVEIATYDTLGAAFQRTHAFRTYEAGDVYELDAAPYVGDQQQAWIGPLPKDDADYNAGDAQWIAPKDLIIRGRTQNGYRPVIKLDSTGASYNTYSQSILYIDKSINVTIENIDFDGGGPTVPGPGKAGIYINGAQGFTLRNSRVMNFTQANGVFSTGNNSGLIMFENVETGFNGGDSGPEHNYYMGESLTDPNHTILWRGCYSHDVYYGHTLKSRAQNNIVEATHLKGKKVSGQDQGEAYLADFPNGGNVTFRNNILEKDYSGDNSNGIFFAYAMEGQHYPNASSVTIVHNTFVAHSESFDSLGHLLSPMNFYYPPVLPTDPAFPIKAVVQANSFAGFSVDPGYTGEMQRYRGDDAKVYPLSNFDVNLVSAAKDVSPNSSLGQLQHSGVVGSSLRATSVYGGID